jgi:hypothetical protein
MLVRVAVAPVRRLVAALPAAPAMATFPGKNGQIAYALFAIQNPDIAVVSEPPNDLIETEPSWQRLPRGRGR